MKHILQRSASGETIVEVLVSFLLLMIFTSMFVVSLRYARAMSQKAETLRETAYALLRWAVRGLMTRRRNGTKEQARRRSISVRRLR